MTGQLEITRVEISKLELKPDDLLAIRFPVNTLRSDIDYFINDLKQILPEHMRIVFFRGDVQISVVSSDLERIE